MQSSESAELSCHSQPRGSASLPIGATHAILEVEQGFEAMLQNAGPGQVFFSALDNSQGDKNATQYLTFSMILVPSLWLVSL